MTGRSRLPVRAGTRPRTTATNPHRQLTQNPGRDLHERLAARLFSFPGVEERPSVVSVPGARALWLRLDAGRRGDNPDAFMVGREFAHLHPLPDGSLHAVLPAERARQAVEAGWGEPHPLAASLGRSGLVMLYAPRTDEELDTIAELVSDAYRFAAGTA